MSIYANHCRRYLNTSAMALTVGIYYHLCCYILMPVKKSLWLTTSHKYLDSCILREITISNLILPKNAFDCKKLLQTLCIYNVMCNSWQANSSIAQHLPTLIGDATISKTCDKVTSAAQLCHWLAESRSHVIYACIFCWLHYICLLYFIRSSCC